MTGTTLAIIPARGGSKSIPRKNLVSFAGRPLVAHVIEAARRCRSIDELVCSTEDETIAETVERLGVTVAWRPLELAADDTPILAVLQHYLAGRHDVDIVPLLQPTSPFLLPEHIDLCVAGLKQNPALHSAQTVARTPHNHHAYNQRVVERGRARFRFTEERRRCYNKQRKPAFFVFGNLVATRRSTVTAGDVFGDESLAFEVDSRFSFDLDGQDDLDYGSFLIETGRVRLPWIG